MKRLLAVASILAVGLATLVAAPAPAQVSGDFPKYAFEQDGTVVIDGDMAVDCRSFASFLGEGYFESGDISPGARPMLEKCEEAGLLSPENATPGASPSALPDTGGLGFPVALVPLVLLAGLLAFGVPRGKP